MQGPLALGGAVAREQLAAFGVKPTDLPFGDQGVHHRDLVVGLFQIKAQLFEKSDF